jgi:hypothetical protein
LPVNSALFGVGFVRPEPDLRLQQRQPADAAVSPELARQETQFAFRDIRPTAMFRRVAKVNPLDVGSRLLRTDRSVERPFAMRVEVVADQRCLRAVGVARIRPQEACAFPPPPE